jgi:hypothetical protein
MAIINNALQVLESKMKPEIVEQAKKEAEEELFRIRLSDLRETYGIRQTEVGGFSQPAISHLENRKDIKISTLLEYLAALGLSVEIKVKPKNHKEGTPKELVLLSE